MLPYYKQNNIILYLGDSKEILKDNSFKNNVHLIVTSPPYFLNREYENIRKEGDVLANWHQYLQLLYDIFDLCVEALVPGGHLWINIDDAYTSLKSSLKKNITLPTHAKLIEHLFPIIDYRETILWYKIRRSFASGGARRMLGSYGCYGSPGSIPIVRENEYILWFKKSGHRSVNLELRKKSALTPEEFIQYGLQTWKIHAVPISKRCGHPAPFPVEIPYRCIKMGSFVGDVILDPFCGSGTTAIACLQTNRKFIGIEKNETYLKMAINRIEDFQNSLF